MNDLQAIADRFEIEALRGEFTDAIMMRNYDRFASRFTDDGAWRIPYINVEHVGQLEGDTAVGRAYILELGHMRDGRSELSYSLYHDRCQRAPDGWKFSERVYEIRYLDSTQLAGSAPNAAGSAR